jgi:hypothetical protein
MKKSINKILAFFSILLASVTFTNCGEDEFKPTVSYTIDGENQKVATVTASLTFETQYNHEGRSLYITAAAGLTKMLSVAISNWDYQNPPDNGILTKTYDATFDFETEADNDLATCLELTGDNTGVFLCDGALVTYIGNNDLYFSAFGGNTAASVTITACSPSKRTISGSFTAKVQNFDEQELTITGEFKNVKYTVN